MMFSYYIALVIAILYTYAVDTRTYSERPLAKAVQYLHYKNYAVNKLNLTEERHKRKALHDSSPFKTHLQVGEISSTCVLNVMDDSRTYFSHQILKYGYNFVYLKLNFTNCKVNDTKNVINKLDWVWTYEGENGAHQYLFLPGDFGYLSFGILWSHTMKKTIRVDISQTGDCSNLQIGTQETDRLIGNALGGMTAQIALHNDAYNSSYWCYNRRLWLSSSFLYHLCRNAVCTYQTIEYSCCKFSVDIINKIRVVQCDNDHYNFEVLWWVFPIILGEVVFAFYPILLARIGMRVNRAIMITKKDTTSSSNSLTAFAQQTSDQRYNTDESVDERSLFISLKQQNPITFWSTIFSPLYRCDFSGPFVSRILRIWIIFLPMTLSIIRVCLDYTYAKDFVMAAVEKGALVGFSSFIAGPHFARENFLYVLGGPVVALAIYVIFGCMVIVFPSNFQLFLDKGLPENKGKYHFLARMPLKLKERFSGVQIRPVTGYNRIHNLFIAQIFMLLNWKFWKHALKLFYLRWRYLFQSVAAKLTTCFAVLSSVIVLPFYILFCLIELICTTLYFVFPVCNCFMIVIKAIAVEYFAVFRNCGLCLKMLRNLSILPLFVLVVITWYMYCILFFDGCWFLSKIAMFTYSGIIAYPRLSYGYMIMVFMALYYLMESLIAFDESYRDLLKLSIEACTKIQSKQPENSDLESMEYSNIMNKHGIKRELFYIVVDKHLPRRNQVMTTILKFASVLAILIISLELLITFDKIQELSLISHVFTVLFICALPKLIRVLCITQMHRHVTRKRLRQKIQRTLCVYMRSHMVERYSDSDEDEFLVISGSGYENLSAGDHH